MTRDSDLSENSILLKTLPAFKRAYTDEIRFHKASSPLFNDLDSHDPCDCRYLFTPEKLKRPQITSWIILQVFCLILQVNLWSEMSRHIFQLDDSLSAGCNELSGTSCYSTSFDVLYSGSLSAGHSSFEQELSFNFQTLSSSKNSPLFLVTVRPTPEEYHSHYSLSFRNEDGIIFHKNYLRGIFSGVVSDRDNSDGKWEGKLVDSETHAFGITRNYLISVQQAKSDQVLAARKNDQCDFEKSWQAANSVFGREQISMMNKIRSWLTYSIFATVFCIYIVAGWYGARRIPMGISFHWLVGIKWALQDMPLQVTILVYIFQWFSDSGERCQLCLFDPSHCELLHPFHFGNLLLISVVLASSLLNLNLFKAKFDRSNEDEWVAVWAARIGFTLVSILPFSTAMVVFNGKLIALPSLVHAIFVLPCMLGWISLICLLCLPIALIIDDAIEEPIDFP